MRLGCTRFRVIKLPSGNRGAADGRKRCQRTPRPSTRSTSRPSATSKSRPKATADALDCNEMVRVRPMRPVLTRRVGPAIRLPRLQHFRLHRVQRPPVRVTMKAILSTLVVVNFRTGSSRSLCRRSPTQRSSTLSSTAATTYAHALKSIASCTLPRRRASIGSRALTSTPSRARTSTRATASATLFVTRTLTDGTLLATNVAHAMVLAGCTKSPRRRRPSPSPPRSPHRRPW